MRKLREVKLRCSRCRRRWLVFLGISRVADQRCPYCGAKAVTVRAAKAA